MDFIDRPYQIDTENKEYQYLKKKKKNMSSSTQKSKFEFNLPKLEKVRLQRNSSFDMTFGKKYSLEKNVLK